MSRYFLCYACCIPVRGHSRAIVCDLQRGGFVFIPNVLVDILELSRERTVEEIHAHYGHEHDAQINEYFDFLAQKDYGFYSDTPQRFPPLRLDWRNPRRLTNCIIDFDVDSRHDLTDLGQQLSGLGCEALELRFFHPLPLAELDRVLRAFRDSTLRSINVVAGYDPSLEPGPVEALLVEHKRVKQVLVHSSPDRNEMRRIDIQSALIYARERITSEACCGNVSSHDFNCNLPTFTEALRFNSCLNRKLGIDTRGALKNCPSMRRSFGDARGTPLARVVEDPEFQRLWTVTKDQVSVCQDCEFRYICHDCRAYVSKPDQPLSKPAKCRYNPYEARWE
jgi:SPASM domain peptide maturase of grasp-with-spasm system